MKKIMYVTIAAAAIFLSCKKADNTSAEVTPRKTITITRAGLYPENGYISGVIEGEDSEGTAFVKEFTHQLDREMATYYVNGRGSYVIHLNKLDKYGRVGEDDKKTDITLTLVKDMITFEKLNDFHTSIYLDSTAATITKFEIDSDGTETMALSNVVFDPNKGVFRCDYILNATNTSTSSARAAKITGKINVTLTNIRFRTGS